MVFAGAVVLRDDGAVVVRDADDVVLRAGGAADLRAPADVFFVPFFAPFTVVPFVCVPVVRPAGLRALEAVRARVVFARPAARREGFAIHASFRRNLTTCP